MAVDPLIGLRDVNTYYGTGEAVVVIGPWGREGRRRAGPRTADRLETIESGTLALDGPRRRPGARRGVPLRGARRRTRPGARARSCSAPAGPRSCRTYEEFLHAGKPTAPNLDYDLPFIPVVRVISPSRIRMCMSLSWFAGRVARRERRSPKTGAAEVAPAEPGMLLP